MNKRTESAAKAHYESGSMAERWDMAQPASRLFHRERMEVALRAADAHDAANQVHRVRLDDAAVERAARAEYEHDWAIPGEPSWDELEDYIRDNYRTGVRVIIAALKGEA